MYLRKTQDSAEFISKFSRYCNGQFAKDFKTNLKLKNYEELILSLDLFIDHWFDLIKKPYKRVSQDWLVLEDIASNYDLNQAIIAFKQLASSDQDLKAELRSILFLTLIDISKLKIKNIYAGWLMFSLISRIFVQEMDKRLRVVYRASKPSPVDITIDNYEEQTIPDFLFIKNFKNLTPLEKYIYLFLTKGYTIRDIAHYSNLDRERLYLQEKALWLKIKKNY